MTSSIDSIQRITARPAEIGGGVTVHRLLPTRGRRTIGAWCFLDHAGPAQFAAGEGMRVGLHPHTGLQTFTWMLRGEVLHRDSLGNVQMIRPGQVNLMTAGHGISHTEESPADEQTLHAAQLWIALPPEHTDGPPAFNHYPDLPTWQSEGAHARYTLLAGTYAGRQAPTKVYTPLVCIDIEMHADGDVDLTLDPAFEYGILVLEGRLVIGGETFVADELAYLGQGLSHLNLEVNASTRLLLVGGVPFGQEIVMWWNFVGLSRQQVITAQHDWEAGHARFGRVAGFDGAPLVAPPLPWPASA